jgi:hypothetical protein
VKGCSRLTKESQGVGREVEMAACNRRYEETSKKGNYIKHTPGSRDKWADNK